MKTEEKPSNMPQGHAAADDVILVAGKGHEDYQEVKGVKHHFSDVEEAREALRKLRNKDE